MQLVKTFGTPEFNIIWFNLALTKIRRYKQAKRARNKRNFAWHLKKSYQMQEISLEAYSIFLGKSFKSLRQILREKQYPKICVLVDENTQQYCLPLLRKHMDISNWEVILIPAGEIYKNIDTCQQIWGQMMHLNIGRRDLCINLGGGVIGDMGGFCARTYKRGIDFIQVPTTLLSQVDASIGGKLGIDFNKVKNSIGVFSDPQAVIIHPEFLQTLPKEEIRSGFAEIIKHSLIQSAEQWMKIRTISNTEHVNWLEFLPPSLEIKKRIVEIDPFEAGIRKALNFGHTVGHAIEGQLLETDNALLHGEAVAIGMICESYISHKISGLSLMELEEITDFLISIYGKHDFSDDLYDDFIQLMYKDKKNERDEINFSLLKQIGECVINQTCSEDLIIASLEYYRNIDVTSNVND